MTRFAKSSIWALCLLLFTACSGDPEDSPEAQIRLLLDSAELAVESRSLTDSMALISTAYTDPEGRDYPFMKRLLMGYFLRNKSIHVVKQIQEISLLSNAAARVVLYAGVAGKPEETMNSLANWRGDLVRLEVELVLDDDEWRLASANWRRASHGDLL